MTIQTWVFHQLGVIPGIPHGEFPAGSLVDVDVETNTVVEIRQQYPIALQQNEEAQFDQIIQQHIVENTDQS